MSLLVPWILFPLVLGALALGHGLLLERVTGVRLGVLLLPAGFAALVVVTQLPTAWSPAARLALPLAVVIAAAGLVLGRRPLWPLDVAPVAAVFVVFAVYAAPIVLSGWATFTGYISLDDTATFLALTDRALEHGRDVSGLAPSTYEAALAVNLANGYPLGTFTPLGVGAWLVHEDPAWVYQPYMAFAAPLLTLALYALLVPLVRNAWIRVTAAVLAAQPALLFAYVLWGGVKEIVAAALLACAAALAARRGEALVPFAVACAALLGVLSAAAAIWIAPLVLVAVARAPARRLALAAAAGLVLAVPAIAAAGEFLRSANRESFQSGDELGNLIRPLRFVQIFGVWPSGDFRVDPDHLAVTRALLAIVVLAAIGGLVLALRAGAFGLPLYALAATTGVAVFGLTASPWVEAKAFAIASPALLALALAAGARELLALPLLVVTAAGVLWSNVAAYSHASLAPRDQLRELEHVGDGLRGKGPALLVDYQVYGARHFLRRLDAESASELRRRFVYLRDGTYLDKGNSADIDRFRLDQVLIYRTLVPRRGPAASRPPSVYELAIPGEFYPAWVKRQAPRILEHLPLGDDEQPGGVPSCDDVQRLARLPGARQLVAAPAAAVVRLEPVGAAHGGVGYAGEIERGGTYEAWLGGSFRTRIQVEVGGVELDTRRHVLNWTGLWTPFGTITLPAEQIDATVRVDAPDWRPGSHGDATFGPLVLRERVDDVLTRVPLARAQSLCNRAWDWIEATG